MINQEHKARLLQIALDKYTLPSYTSTTDLEFRRWFVQWIQLVDCELNPDVWMDMPFTSEESEVFNEIDNS